MVKLDKITVEGFKSIRDVEMELHDLNILIGPNGGGKSNFIELFALLSHLVDGRLQDYVVISGGADRLLYFGSKTTNSIEIRVWFSDSEYSCTLTAVTSDSLAQLPGKLLALHGESIVTPSGEKPNRKKRQHHSRYFQEFPHVRDSIRSWRIFHFHDTSESAKVKKHVNIDDNAYLRTDASNLAAFLYLLKRKYSEYYKNIVDTIKLVAPFFKDFELRPNPLNEDSIKLKWKHEGTDAYFDASSLSDGTLRFMCLTTLLLQPNPPTTIIIDEPELGLHPYAITILAGMLKAVSKRAQVIVSTQSVTLVDHFTPEDIVVVEMENNETVMKRLSSKELANWLEDYTLGELWEKNIFGGRPK